MRWMLHTLVAVTLSLGAGSCRGAEASGDDFHRGRQAVIEGRFDEALPLLRGYLKAKPSGKHASRAALHEGKALLGAGRYAEAEQAFERCRTQYGHTLEGHKCEYKLALVAMLSGKKDLAKQRFGALAGSAKGPYTPESKAMVRYLK